MIELNKLRTASELKGKIKEIFTDEQLEVMAKDYKMPHYIITNPIEGKDYLYFNQNEVNDWYIDHFVKHNACKVDQELRFVEFNAIDANRDEPDDVPIELSRVQSLYRLPVELLQTPPGIYFLCQDKEIVYIGQAINVAKRIVDHIYQDAKVFNRVYYIQCHKDRLFEFEMSLIRRFQPKYNKEYQRNFKPCSEADLSLFDSICKQTA